VAVYSVARKPTVTSIYYRPVLPDLLIQVAANILLCLMFFQGGPPSNFAWNHRGFVWTGLELQRLWKTIKKPWENHKKAMGKP